MLLKKLLPGVLVVGWSITVAAGAGDLRLPEAAMRGDSAAVKLLLEQQADVNAAQGDGMTALHWAVYKNDLEMAETLIRAGANLKAGTRIESLTPLLFAATNGSRPMIEILLKAGADPNSANQLGTTPLMQAAASSDVDAVRTLLDYGATLNAKENVRQHTAMMFAAALNRAEVVALLASRGADLNAVSKVFPIGENLIDENGDPIPAPSRTGSTKGRPKNAGQLLGTGGWTALHYAAREGHGESVRALVEAGADVNKVNTLDKTSPLVLAIANGNYDVARYLLDHGADPRIANTDGLAALYAVLDSRWAPVSWTPTPATNASGVVQQKVTYLDLMQAILERGANPNDKILRTLWFNPPHHHYEWAKVPGATPFWRAAQATDISAMKLLLAHGADPKILTESGVTPLSVAAGVGWIGNYSINSPDGFVTAARYLIEELGLPVNVADNEGYTPLMGAAWRGDKELVEYLIAKGADIKARNAKGWAVTDMANGPDLSSSAPRKFPEIVALLEKMGAPAPIKVDDEEILGTIKRKLDPLTGQFITEPEKKETDSKETEAKTK